MLNKLLKMRLCNYFLLSKYALLCMMFCFLSSCGTRVYKLYEYKSINLNFENFTIKAWLQGDYSYAGSDHDTTLGNPYDLAIAIELNESIKKPVATLSDIRLSHNGKDVFYHEVSTEKEFLMRNAKETQVIYFSYENLSLDYVNYTLHVKLKVADSEMILTEEALVLPFETEYTEYTRYKLQDRLIN